MQLLSGLRVVDMSHVIAGPMASLYLANMGADVIKIERVQGGDVLRNMKPAEPPTDYISLNAGKRSLAIDLRDPQAQKIVHDLVRTADVFIENFKPGVVAKFGLDYDTLKAVKPDLIYCSISGYGQKGAWAGQGGYDAMIQALTGIALAGGEGPDAPPAKVGFPVVDIATGVLGALSILAAVLQRDRLGKGERIDVSMVHSSLLLMYPLVTNYLTSGKQARRTGNRGYSGSPASTTFRCHDGWLAVSANTPGQFKKMADFLGLSRLYQDPALLDLELFNSPQASFVVARDYDAVQNALAAALLSMSSFEAERKLNELSVPAARCRSAGEFIDLAKNNEEVALPLTRYQSNEHTVTTAGLGFSFDSAEPVEPLRCAELGDDTRAILRELGLSDDSISELEERGVVGLATAVS
ncbi:MAG: CoA transferase [Candidimonas sp.]